MKNRLNQQQFEPDLAIYWSNGFNEGDFNEDIQVLLQTNWC